MHAWMVGCLWQHGNEMMALCLLVSVMQKCKMIAESKEEMAVAQPHMSDDEDDEKSFGGGVFRESKGISFNLSVMLHLPEHSGLCIISFHLLGCILRCHLYIPVLPFLCGEHISQLLGIYKALKYSMKSFKYSVKLHLLLPVAPFMISVVLMYDGFKNGFKLMNRLSLWGVYVTPHPTTLLDQLTTD